MERKLNKLGGSLLATLTLVGMTVPAFAMEKAAMLQVVDDLGSQLKDKAKLDVHAAAKLEVARVKSLLKDARNAAREEEEEEVDRLLTLVRAELKLIDGTIELSQLEAKLAKRQSKLDSVEARVAAQKKDIETKTATLNAYRLKAKGGQPDAAAQPKAE